MASKKGQFQQKASGQTQKTQWPGLVGKTGDEAKAIIMSENPSMEVIVINELAMTTSDYRKDRVRIRTDYNGIVSTVPLVG